MSVPAAIVIYSVGKRERGKRAVGGSLREIAGGVLEVGLVKSIRLTAEVTRGRAASLSASEPSRRPKMDASGSPADFLSIFTKAYVMGSPCARHAQSLNISRVCA